MQVEHIAGVGFTSGGTTEQQGDFTIGDGLFRQVVVDDQRGTSRVAEVLTDGGACERSIELHGCRVGGGSRNDNRVGHGAVFRQGLDDAGHGRTLLADGDIDAIYGVAFLVEFLLVDDGIDGDGGLTCLPVADNQLTLSAADGDHGVNGLDTGLEGFLHGLAIDDTRGFAFEGHFIEVAFDFALAVDGVAQRVDDAAAEPFTHSDGGDTPCALTDVAFVQGFGLAEQHDTDVVFLKVQDDAHNGFVLFFKYDQLAGLCVLETIYASDAIAHQQNGSHFRQIGLGVVAL